METVLLIENDPAKLVLQSLILHCFGYTVLEAVNRGEVWRVCGEHEGPIHLLVTAVQDGDSISEWVAELQLIYPQIRALFVSDASSAELANTSSEHAFLQRPFRVDDLANTIRGLLDGAKIELASSFA